MRFTLSYKNIIFPLIIKLLFVLGYGQDYISSRATYFVPNPQGNSNGACGYGDYGRTANDGYVAGVYRPFKSGLGCGGCYQVKCKKGECTDDGVVVVATDFGMGDGTDFILADKAYAKMARPGFEAQLLSYGVVNIDYRRVPCTFRGSSLIFDFHESSRLPNYISFIITYNPNVVDVVDLQIWEAETQGYKSMRKPYGAVWDMANPPGPLNGIYYIRYAIGSGTANPNTNAATRVLSPPILIPTHFNKGANFQLAINQTHY